MPRMPPGGYSFPCDVFFRRVIFRRVHLPPMKTPSRKLPESVVRLVTVFAVFIAGTIVVVKFVIPPRFKDTSIQWADTVRRENARPVRFAGAVACEIGRAHV